MIFGVENAELRKYITKNENNEWTHSPDMPTELEEEFQQFLRDMEQSQAYKGQMK